LVFLYLWVLVGLCPQPSIYACQPTGGHMRKIEQSEKSRALFLVLIVVVIAGLAVLSHFL
jgi:hypothetical protein